MTVSATNTGFAAPRHQGLRASIARFISGMASGYAAYRTYNALNRLTDEQLSDIGLTRADVPRAAAGEILRG